MTTTITTDETGITFTTKTADSADAGVRERRHASKGEGYYSAVELTVSAAGECGLAVTTGWTTDGGRSWTRGKRTYHRTVSAGMAAADQRWAKLLTRLA